MSNTTLAPFGTLKKPGNPDYLAILRRKRTEYSIRIHTAKQEIDQIELEPWSEEEYRKRVASKINFKMDAIYKMTLLARILREDSVNVVAHSTTLRTDNPDTFDIVAYEKAVAVIADYCETGGIHTQKNGP